MNLITIVIIAIGLAMDTFAVSIVSGSGTGFQPVKTRHGQDGRSTRQLRVRQALLMAIFFGGFQFFMPLVGSLAGLGLKGYIADYDHWVAFGLLAAVGCKMIYESFKMEPTKKNLNFSNIFVLLILSVATSIDALAVGVTISLITTSVARAAIIIGLVTFTMSYLGVFIGKNFGHFFESRVEAVGGVVLIGIGLKIVLEHLL